MADVGFGQPFGHLHRARVAEAARAQRDLLGGRERLEAPVIEQVSLGIVEVHRHRAAARVGRQRTVEANHVAAVAVLQGGELAQQPSSKAADAGLNQLEADRCEMLQPDLDRRNAEVVQRPVLEPRLARGQDVRARLHGREVDGAAGEPGAVQRRQHLVSYQKTTHACRITEHLVERDADKVRLHLGQIEPVGGNEGGRIEQHVPSARVRVIDELERMLHAAEIRLRGIREESRAGRGRRQHRVEAIDVDPQLRHADRDVLDGSPLGARELADAVHRVVVVDRQQELRTGAERVGLPHVLQRAGRIRREHRRVVVWRRVEPREHRVARLLDELGHPKRRGAGGVRIAEDVLVQDRRVSQDLRLGVKAAAGIVEIRLPLVVQPPVLLDAQRVDGVSGGVLGEVGEELFVLVDHG